MNDSPTGKVAAGFSCENGSAAHSEGASTISSLRALRVAFADDPHRPLYHFLAPANWMNDPNGASFWSGKYHLFYQYNPNGPFWGTIHWGHAASSDLIHWEDLPIALTPSKNGPDKNGCWSGCVVFDRSVPTAFYTGLEPQTVCVATSKDELRTWLQNESPVISEPPPGLELTGFPSITGHPSADFRDPFVWGETGRWFMLIGAGLRQKGGTALLYDSDDLRRWQYRGPILSGVIGADCNMWECPVLLRFGSRSVLLVCPHPEAKYVYWIAGEWRGGTLQEYRRGRLDLGTYVYAAQSLHDSARDRYLVWTWIKEGRSERAQRSAGWSGLLSLPKQCGLDSNGILVIEPAKELASLRGEGRSIMNERFVPSTEEPFSGFTGDCLEIEAELSFAEPAICDLWIRVSPDQAEHTKIIYNSAEKTLTVDCADSSLDPSVDHHSVSGALVPDLENRIRFRVFLDRSVLEVFLADRACITQRLYPTREDSLGLSFRIRHGSALVHRLSVWKMTAIWPDRAKKGEVAD
jgi:beta-fructofuranosidase